ncbi:type II/IV secretion system protein, partial [Candidatus Peregrinibacteria bacterium]|nr:type II/IV secretion system protein [Candidatus Peregrinibacteria bacterium]
RISPEKRFEWLLDLAERCGYLKFVVVGAGNYQTDYERELLERAFTESRGDANSLIRIILRDGLLSEEQLGMLKAHAYQWYFIDISNEPFNSNLLNKLPLKVAEAQQAIPYTKEEGAVHIACLDFRKNPFHRILQKKFGYNAKFFLTSTGSFNAAIAQYDVDFKEKCEEILTRSKSTSKIGSREDTTISELFDALVQHSLRENASDIHMEPQKHSVIVRERVDGILHKVLEFSHDVYERLTQRMKLLAYLAIDEHSIPQDGKIVYEGESGIQTDIRVSTVPTRYGEKVVCRLLRSGEMRLPLEALGISADNMKILEEEMKQAWGMILVTGPTGSGKTSTLYAILQRLNEEKVNISTVEDPVEYELRGANQIQINNKVELTFAKGLRALMRQDPDIILVGEIRDKETANIAVNAAMTGHTVLSTLHTNDAPTAVPRLLDMDVEAFLIYSTVNVIIAQRLVRKICVGCRHSERIKIEEQDYAPLLPKSAIETLKQRGDPTLLFRGKGCDRCNGSGYSGRMAIHEFLRVDDSLKDMILNKADSDTIRNEAIKSGMKTMFQDGIAKVMQGETTIEEVLRVSQS